MITFFYSFNFVSAQTKLPNCVLYDLLDCVNDDNAFNAYLKAHSLSGMSNKLKYVPFSGKKYYIESYAKKVDSLNQKKLSMILDTLRFYNVKRSDLISENFRWVYKKFGDQLLYRSIKNGFNFEKNSKTIRIFFPEIGFFENRLILADTVSFWTKKSIEKSTPILMSASIEDPIKKGEYLADLLQAGKIDEFCNSFMPKKVIEAILPDNSHNESLEVVKESKRKVHFLFYPLRPGSYKVSFEFMNLERRSESRYERDSGYYNFAVKHDNSETFLNIEIYLFEDKIYLTKYKN
ncbi:hypothetical protein [Flavobacterium sp. 270]|uniref:hypothetical protein n=1 Tax=Flavobacterium sp. 270 TaxID=2512114 RepID=UPI001066BA73|nr:hypothetical protein [Flavobacterium sp. 270]